MSERTERKVSPVEAFEMIAGFGFLVGGVAAWSLPAASCVAGAVLLLSVYAARRTR